MVLSVNVASISEISCHMPTLLHCFTLNHCYKYLPISPIKLSINLNLLFRANTCTSSNLPLSPSPNTGRFTPNGMQSFTLLLVLLAALCLSHAAADCSVSIQQTLGSAWKQDGVDMSQWNAQLTAGSAAAKSVQLAITGAGAITQLWELTRTSSGLYVLPNYRLQSGGLPADQVHQFGYI